MLQSKQVAAKKPLSEPTSAGHPVTVYGEYIVPAGGLTVNSIIEMTGIPAGTVPTSWWVACEDLDSDGTPAVVFSVGKLSGLYGNNDDARTYSADFATGLTIGQAGGITGNTLAGPQLYAPNANDVGVAIKITTAPDVVIAGAKIRLFVTCIPGDTLLS